MEKNDHYSSLNFSEVETNDQFEIIQTNVTLNHAPNEMLLLPVDFAVYFP